MVAPQLTQQSKLVCQVSIVYTLIFYVGILVVKLWCGIKKSRAAGGRAAEIAQEVSSLLMGTLYNLKCYDWKKQQ